MLKIGTKVRIKTIKEYPFAGNWDGYYRQFCGLVGRVVEFESLEEHNFFRIDFDNRNYVCTEIIWKTEEVIVLKSKELNLE